ncbi:MAG: hypothetical protein ABI904_07820 [Chloroflexota bacterium]
MKIENSACDEHALFFYFPSVEVFFYFKVMVSLSRHFMMIGQWLAVNFVRVREYD